MNRMSAAYQEQQYPNNFSTPMDFPNEFLEPSISSAPIMQSRTNPMFSANTGYSSANNSLSSSQNRLVCDDSGVSSNIDASSSMQFLSSALSSTVNDCMEQNTMNFVGNDLLDDLEPQPRSRCNTWPMNPRHTTHEYPSNNLTIQEGIQEEEEILYSKNASQASVHLLQDPFINNNAMNSGYQVHHVNSQEQELNYDSHNDYSGENSPESEGEEDYQGGVQKRSQTRRNAWGNMSYADLITQAILSAPDQRLTLSQIYEWMVANVPYFSDKGDSNSSAGWKNSIRHNLSLHNRFMRLQNEGAGKSSWWVINPDAKSRHPRRRATMDNSSAKHIIEKKRRGARKRVEMQGGLINVRKASQPEFYFNHRTKEEADNDSDYDSFRSRTLSNISAPGGNQVSPTFNPNNEDFHYQAWAPNASIQSEHDNNAMQYTNCNTMKDLMNRTDQITLDTDADLNQMTPMNSNQQQMGGFSNMSQQVSPNFQEDIKPQFQHGSYQELKPVRGVDQRMQNPLLRTQLTQPTHFQQFSSNQQPQQNRNDYPFGCNSIANQQRWQMNNSQQGVRFVQQNGCSQQLATVVESPMISSPPVTQSTTMSSNFNRGPMVNNLPKDLENLNAFVPPDCDLQGIDEIIQEELATTNNLNFEFSNM